MVAPQKVRFLKDLYVSGIFSSGTFAAEGLLILKYEYRLIPALLFYSDKLEFSS